MTPRTRKLTVAAIVLVIGVVVGLVSVRRGEPMAATFLRYENDGESVVIQITNRSRSPIECFVAFEADPPPLPYSTLEPQEGRELQYPAMQRGLRFSRIVVVYHSQQSGLGEALEGLGIRRESRSFDSKISVTLPPAPPKTPLP